MLILFIIVAVVAIVVYSAEHNLATLGQFVDYAQHDTLTVMTWLVVLAIVHATSSVFCCPSCKTMNGPGAHFVHGKDYEGMKQQDDHRFSACEDCGCLFSVKYAEGVQCPSNDSYIKMICDGCGGAGKAERRRL